MTFTVSFQQRDSTQPPARKPSDSLNYDVRRYSKDIYGGPKEAFIDVTGGTKYDRWGLVGLLRNGIIIHHSERAKEVWWGIVQGVTIFDAHLSIEISLDSFGNTIAVASSYLGDRITTDWATDTKSVNLFGTYEMLISETDKSLEAAEARRDTELELRKYPVPKIRITHAEKKPRVELRCTSFLSAMNRRYWAQDEGYEEYTESGRGDFNMGDNDVETVAQGFQLSSLTGWDVKKIDIKIRKEESPTDNVEIVLKQGASIGSASTLGTTASVSYTDIGDSIDWVTFTFATAITLSTSTQYWFQVQRTGPQDATNYYVVDANEDVGYESGEGWIYENAAWAASNPPQDFNFRIYGEKETTAQMDDVLTDTAEFISSFRISPDSSVFTNQYRDGDDFAMVELQALMDIGDTSSNPYIAEVFSNRHLDIRQNVTTENSPDYVLGSDGILRERNGRIPVYPEDCVVGVWVKLENIIPDSFDSAILTQVRSMFVTEAEYSNGLWRPLRTKGYHDAFDILGGDLLT